MQLLLESGVAHRFGPELRVPLDRHVLDEPPTTPEEEYSIWVPFSLDSPYLVTGEEEDVPTRDVRRDFYYVPPDNRNLDLPADEEPSSTALTRLFHAELTTLFHDATTDRIRGQRDFTTRWWELVGTSKFGEITPTLPRDYFVPGHRFGVRAAREEVEKFFNKYIAIYFQRTSARKPDDRSYRSSLVSRKLGLYVYRHWRRMYQGRPPFQPQHFLAHPIDIVQGDGYNPKAKGKGHEHLVTDLPYVLAFHKSLCDSVAAREDDIKHGSQWRSEEPARIGRNPRRNPDFAPRLSMTPMSYRQHGFRLNYLFRALFIVDDGLIRHDFDNPDEAWSDTDYYIEPAPESDDTYHCSEAEDRDWDWFASRHQVLLVRTGDDSHLSEPISFQPLFDSGRALPLAREDYGSWEDVVRLRLDHALEFVEHLIRREERALPDVGQAAEALEDELDELCEQWIGKVLEHAAEVGIDKNGFTWQALRRAHARLNGEAFDMEQVSPYFESVVRWFPGG